MKKYQIGAVVVFLVVASSLVFFSQRKAEKSVAVLPSEVVFHIEAKNVACEFTRKTVRTVDENAVPVKNANNLKAFKMTFADESQAWFVVSNEDPFRSGQTFLAATNCQPVEETSELVAQSRAQSCTGIYRHNPQTGQIRRDCGFVFNEKAVFLAPVNQK